MFSSILTRPASLPKPCLSANHVCFHPTYFHSTLQNLVSERDDERDRMRKELVASRERLHLLHMRQNSASSQTVASTQAPPSSTHPTTSSPYTSRPSSFVSVTSSVADHSDTSLQHDTDEGKSWLGLQQILGHHMIWSCGHSRYSKSFYFTIFLI